MFTLIIIGFITFYLIIHLKNAYSYWEKRGIKTPKIIPLLGTLLDEIKEEPRKTEQRYLREFGNVFGTYFGTKPVLNTSKVEHLKEIFSDAKRFHNEQTVFDFNDNYLKHGIFLKNGHAWKTGRAAQTYYFTSKKFRNLLPHFEKCSRNLLDNIESLKKNSKTGDINSKELAQYYGVDCISKVLFAIDINSFEQRDGKFVKSALRIGHLNLIQASLMTILPKTISKILKLTAFEAKPIEDLGDYFKKMIRDRRKDGVNYNDLTELLQDAVDDNKVKLTEDEIIGNILTAFLAGVEPVANAISNQIYFLSQYPTFQEKLRKEVIKEFSGEITYEALTQNELLEAFVQESLRLGNNLFTLSRTCSEDTKLSDGLSLEKGTEIRLIIDVPHINAESFTNPLIFNPDRWLKSNSSAEDVKDKSVLFIPFGYGPRQCLGMRLALLKEKYIIVRILQNYKISKADNNETKDEYIRGFVTGKIRNVKFNKLNN